MPDPAAPQRGDYSVRDAFLEDLQISRDTKRLRSNSGFWEVVEDLVAKNTNLATRLEAVEARLAALEETLTTGQQ